MSTATITPAVGDRGLCEHCGIIAHEDRHIGAVVHTGTLQAECGAPGRGASVAHSHPNGPICSPAWCGSARKVYR
jgi:hypothetical protein